MCFSFTAKIAWSGQRRNAINIALLVKGYAILIGWWAGILAFSEVNNDHSLCFPPDQRVVTFCFGFFSSTNSSGWHFLVPSSGLRGSSNVEVTALELFLLDPAMLDLIVAVL
jgi:hypothetical protein